MKNIVKIVSLCSLLLLTLPSFFYLGGAIEELSQVKWLMLLATIIWFVTATMWMWKEDNSATSEGEAS